MFVEITREKAINVLLSDLEIKKLESHTLDGKLLKTADPVVNTLDTRYRYPVNLSVKEDVARQGLWITFPTAYCLIISPAVYDRLKKDGIVESAELANCKGKLSLYDQSRVVEHQKLILVERLKRYEQQLAAAP